ncbi:bifunctional diguanylate cyclase/phosphodiesterase [Parachitinimonas caeni]|uniref:EAL domain-containing protein n=1 Tax=Parachitinimonas caeni TaxID=3031301 RepID=A0ABT7E0N2_9NEIS|nr:EAL domain-containing protein [Parachitinimonas caeni]MDK2124990.1 EAL domain-containing protein [Parachitinimonas caeni]
MAVIGSEQNDIEALRQQLAAFQDYIEVVDSATELLIDPDVDAVREVLHTLARACRADAAAFYRNVDSPGPEPAKAEMAAYWHRADLELPTDIVARLFAVDYQQYQFLRDTLSAGMILARPLAELTPSAQLVLGRLGVHHLRCIPLLDGGELIGFIALLARDDLRQRPSLESRLLSTVANHLALALVKKHAETQSRATEMRLKTLVGATEDMVFEFNPLGLIVNVWSTHPVMPNYNLVGMTLERALPPEMASRFTSSIGDVLSGNQAVQVEFSVPRLNGAVYFLARLQAVPAIGGEASNIVALVRDVSELMREESRRKTMLDTLNLLEEAVLDLSPEGNLQHTTPAWAKLRGIEVSRINEDFGKPLSQWIYPDERERLADTLTRLVQTEEQTAVRFRLMHESSEPIWLEARLLAVKSGNELVGIRGILRDITIAHLNERHIMKLALYDGLTGLPNRIMLDDVLHQAIARAKRHGTKVALGFIDLDHFKQVNDAFGHRAGDEVLISIARQLKSVLREEDTLARWGGDEFVVLLPDLADLQSLHAIGERLREIARQGVVIDGIETKPTISIGIAVFPDNADSGEELMSAADSTMYHAKSAGRNNVQFYNDIMHLKVVGREHMAIQTRLNNVVLDNELQVFYQPVVHARTGEITSVEALVRWHDDKTGWVSPQLFIPMAEKLGLIQELSEQVMMQALGKLRSWRDMGLKQRLALNVSRNQLFSPRLISNLMDIINHYHLRPADVVVEITESLALTDYSRQSRHLRELANAGFTIAIDDFGTGYSSLSQLHEMPIDILKVDISFTSRLHTEAGRRIMQAIVQMGQSLGMEIVVEGVENVETARFLQGLGVEHMQGYYFSEPVPAGVCELLMRLGLQSKI